MIKKRGQAALEWLMTYGWALIMILVVIAAITYFGVINPKQHLPNRCLLSPEIECQAYGIYLEDNTILLRLKNNFGSSITVTDLELTAESANTLTCTNPSYPANWLYTNAIDLTFTNCNLDDVGFSPGKSVKLGLYMSFYPVRFGSSYKNTVLGEIITKVS
jgi:hypothetical protein